MGNKIFRSMCSAVADVEEEWGKMSRGRISWLDGIKDSLKKKMETIKEYIRDRDIEWKKVVFTAEDLED